MAEFTIQATTHRLLNLLDIPKAGKFVEVYGDTLSKNVQPYVTTQIATHNAKRRIAEFSPTPDDFLTKYDELKGKNFKDLDAFVCLLSKMCEDKRVIDYLGDHCKDKAKTEGLSLTSVRHIVDTLNKTGPTVNQLQLNTLKSELLRETASVHINQHTPLELRKALRETYTKRNPSVIIPQLPGWVNSRPYLSMDFISSPGQDDNVIPLGSMPLTAQEQCLIDDILSLLTGVNGKYIYCEDLKTRFGDRKFVTDPTTDQPMAELVSRILPLIGNYSLVTRFVEEKSAFEYGLVTHGVCAAMRSLLKEYYILVTQLEHQHYVGSLSLQKVWFYLQPCMQTMAILSSLAFEVIQSEAAGGGVLSLLHRETTLAVGNPRALELLLFLMQSACVPFFEILENWIYKGVIMDPYCEFFVEENLEDGSRNNWETRYYVCRDRIPSFLESMAEKVLSTGKYLNAVRNFGRDVQCPDAEEITYSAKEKLYVDKLDHAYEYASKTLLNYLIEDMDLLMRLRSIKHYFLMDEGDYIVDFLDMSEDELKRDAEKISVSKLSSIMELAIRSSVVNQDPYRDDVRLVLIPYDLITQLFRILAIETRQERSLQLDDPTEIHLSGLESLAVDYEVKWPLTLIISDKNISKYQMIFRHVFYMKWVVRQLSHIWQLSKDAKRNQSRTYWYREGFAVRDRMLNFVKNLQLYTVFEVLEPQWHIFEQKLKSATNVDDVMGYQQTFLDRCLHDSMLTIPDLLKLISKLLACVIMFCNWMTRFYHSTRVHVRTEVMTDSTLQATLSTKQVGEMAERNRLAKQASSLDADQAASMTKFTASVKQFEKNFDRYLSNLLQHLKHYSEQDGGETMTHVLYRLDYSGYYQTKLANMSRDRRSKYL